LLDVSREPCEIPDMTKSLGELLAEGRRAKGLTLEQAANALEVSSQAVLNWEKGKTAPEEARARRICDLYKIDRNIVLSLVYKHRDEKFRQRTARLKDRKAQQEQLIEDLQVQVRQSVPPVSVQNAPNPTPNAIQSTEIPTEALAAQIYMPLDVPVLGVSMGGKDHDFQFNGITVDYVRRPPGIANAKRAYAVWVIGESMLPVYRENSVVYVNPDKPPAIGDDVVIELHPDDGHNEAGAAYIKRLKKRTAERIVVEQFNPSRDIEFDRGAIKAMHRVVPWNELLAI